MKKLIAILGILGTISGYMVDISEVESILMDPEYSVEQRVIAIEYITEELELLLNDIEEGNELFGPHYCNNY